MGCIEIGRIFKIILLLGFYDSMQLFYGVEPLTPHLSPLALARNRNRKLLISRAPTKAKSQEPAYSQALNQNKIDRQRSRSKESGRQTVRRLWWMVFGV